MSDKSVWFDVADLIIKVIGFGAAAGSLWFTAQQIKNSNEQRRDANRQSVAAGQWRRKEFANTAIRKFFEDPYVWNAMLMMDWMERDLVLSKDHAVMLGQPKFTYYDSMLPEALNKPSSKYSTEEIIIRDCFDAFFGGMQQFIDLTDSRIMEYEDFKPYFGYWAQLLHGKVPHKSAAALAAINAYIKKYFDEKKIKRFLAEVE